MPPAIEALYQGVESADGFDRLHPLEAIVDQAHESGGLRPIPESQEAFQEHPDLIRRMKKRLFLLGYLKKKSNASQLSTKDRHAIRIFQKEAGITVDGWVGKESWRVMEDLFSFEADSNIVRWVTDPGVQSLLNRAVQLRLFSMGLIAVGPAVKLVEVLSGLQRFVDLMNRLGVGDGLLEANRSFDTLDLLFDQARITRAIHRATLERDLGEEPQLKAFVVCHAKIELWLLGYPILPDGKGTYKRPPRRRRKGKTIVRANRYQTFHRVLKMFCEDVNPGRPKSKRLSVNKFDLQCSFYFEEFVEAQESSPEMGAVADTQLLVDTLRAHPEEALGEWKQQRSFAGRLWDGVNRAWGWLKRLFKRVVGVVTSLVRNAIRVVWSLAVHSIGLVQAALRSFPDAVRYFLRPEVKGSNPEAVVFFHDTDFDWRVYVAPHSSKALIAQAIQSLRDQVVRFTFSVRVVGLLIHTLFRSVRGFPTGFLAIFLAIARIQPMLDPFLDYYLANKSTLLA